MSQGTQGDMPYFLSLFYSNSYCFGDAFYFVLFFNNMRIQLARFNTVQNELKFNYVLCSPPILNGHHPTGGANGKDES